MATATSAMSLCVCQFLHIQVIWIRVEIFGGNARRSGVVLGESKSFQKWWIQIPHERSLGDDFVFWGGPFVRLNFPLFLKTKHRRFSVFRLQILNKMSGITKAQLKEMMENEVRFKLCRAECKIPWLFSEYLEVERWIDSEEESNISSR